MKIISNTRIELKEKLSEKDYTQIKNLESICIKKDQISLKLELDYKLEASKYHQEILNEHNEFMFYEDNLLIGYIGICHFGSSEIEVNGMVHPDFRRKGIFKDLYTKVKDEFNLRSCDKMLLLSDKRSLSGQEFIKTTGAIYDFSEYEMYLKDLKNKKELLNKLTLRKATNEDAKEIAIQNAIYAGKEFNEEQITLPEDEDKSGFTIFIAEFDSKIIGKVNLELNHGVGGIYGLGVLPEFRGKGYGREILMKSIEKFKDSNAQEVKLQVVTENSTALNLYKSCGFEVTSIMNYYSIIK
ncbi:GNAT family N-acetyltransferase [Oceanirhabdus sp. W0125-5]|uniref:GNAT family N-acetyltransferase n=1 Tax=Oceanirhabdus sp. W0125-5 TaxID=2999116 RepID=UPI0022F2DAA9|nr:GNAT family N-acetyltransferase [Oceanirhabdus sp. W0125-5]WBW98988.1 GNAT family N-acetyltransferase [Oceanirhabdus sp. W0125-5]